MGIQKDIPELLKAGVITPETAEGIRQFYKRNAGSSSNRLFVVFGILGAILVGLGIILILAHNWDELSRSTKTIFAFLPLVVAQAICVFVLLKRWESTVWRESATTLLFFAVGACISLVGQIYHIPGNLSSFFLTWMLLCLPLIYVMKSSAAALLYLLGITYYAAETSYFSYHVSDFYIYWALLIAVLPHYFLSLRNRPKSNFLLVGNWLIPVSLTIVLGTLSADASVLMYVAYFSLFALFYIIGNTPFFTDKDLRNNPYKVIGALGTLVLLFMCSFEGFWRELQSGLPLFKNWIMAREFWVAILLSVAALLYLYRQQKNKPLRELPILSPIFLVFIPIFIIGYFTTASAVLINLIILAVSILKIVEGAKREHLGILNLGLSIITIWIAIRFLNTDLSFVIRGLILMTIGIGFFMANYLMLKKRKRNG